MDRNLLYRFYEGIASLKERMSVKEWAEASEENAATLRRERKLFDAMILAGQLEEGEVHLQKRRWRNRVIGELLKMASVVAVTAGILLWTLTGSERHASALTTITVPAGQRANLELPDGSNVWLNAGTRLQYPASFQKGKREVTLDGEAYFEVEHQEECPFIVHTHVMDVEVLGTTFNVEASSARNTFETSLIEGKVKVQSPCDEHLSVILLPAQKTTLSDGRLVVGSIDDYNVYRWKEGLYCFRDKPFSEIMKDMERYYDLRIDMDASGIADVALTGKFRISDGLDYALRVLQNQVSFTYRRDKDDNIIYIK